MPSSRRSGTSSGVRVARSERAAGAIVSAALRLAWGFRLELTISAMLAEGWSMGDRRVGPVYTAIAFGLFLSMVAAWPTARRWVWRQARFARVKRRFASAVRAAGFDRDRNRVPVVLRSHDTTAGYRLRVLLPRGRSVLDLAKSAETAAAAMGVSAFRVTRDPVNASKATVTVIQRDPLAAPEPLTWALAQATTWSIWEPIPVGIDENGSTVSVYLPEHNLLLGGEPGAGKSAALSLLVAAAALDPAVTMWLFDGKRVELACWAACAARLVGPDQTEAVDVLEGLRQEMDLRYAQLLAWGRRKVAPDDGLGLHVVVIDELALYLSGGERKTRERLAEALRDLVARGRAAGVIVLAATQKPSSDVIPTSVRDLFGFRWAMRCATREASDTILGSGWSAEGYSAADVDASCRGVGYLLHEGGVPVRLRASYLDDVVLANLALRASSFRMGPRP
jgi:hypothetical protein